MQSFENDEQIMYPRCFLSFFLSIQNDGDNLTDSEDAGTNVILNHAETTEERYYREDLYLQILTFLQSTSTFERTDRFSALQVRFR